MGIVAKRGLPTALMLGKLAWFMAGAEEWGVKKSVRAEDSGDCLPRFDQRRFRRWI